MVMTSRHVTLWEFTLLTAVFITKVVVATALFCFVYWLFLKLKMKLQGRNCQ